MFACLAIEFGSWADPNDVKQENDKNRCEKYTGASRTVHGQSTLVGGKEPSKSMDSHQDPIRFNQNAGLARFPASTQSIPVHRWLKFIETRLQVSKVGFLKVLLRSRGKSLSPLCLTFECLLCFASLVSAGAAHEIEAFGVICRW